MPTLSPDAPFPQNFHNFFRKDYFFRKTCLIIKYPVLIRNKKKLRRPLSQKNGQIRPQNSFLQYHQKTLLFSSRIIHKGD